MDKMNSCRDCVHHICCAVYAPTFNDILANGEDCSEFKDKYDFVKVVRCKDCKWWIKEVCTYSGGAYGMTIFNPNWFCCAGMRKE